MREQQFIELPSQGTIYSVGQLGNALLVGSGDHGKLFAYCTSKGSVEEVPLSDLPSDIEIIAVDCFEDPFPVLALTYAQKSIIGNDPEDFTRTASLHIYSATTHSESPTTTSPPDANNMKSSSPPEIKDSNNETSYLEIIGQQCKIFKLDYLPYDMCHLPVKQDSETYEQVLLLTGSDKKIHTFQADKDRTAFSEISTNKYFPELSGTFDSVVTRVQVESFNDATRRISLCGCEDGSLHIWIVSCTPKSSENSGTEVDDDHGSEIIDKIEHHFDGMITSLQFYTDGFQINTVVASACSPTYIYTNTIEDKFAKGTPLKFSSKWDAVEAVCIADIDLDGRAEIIVGTFGCTMLVYKYLDDISTWVIVAHKKFPNGVLSIDFVELSLIVVTAGGIHVLEYSTSAYFQKRGHLLLEAAE